MKIDVPPVDAMAPDIDAGSVDVPATILIVDDELQNRRLLEALLKPEGYLTVCAANGEEALALIALRAPDLILLDLMMPGIDGYEVASTLKADPATSHIPIVIVSAYSDRSARLVGLECGAEEFLTKPVDRAELWIRVRNLLRLKSLSDFHKKHSSDLQVELRASELFAQATIDSVTSLICVLDETGKIIAVNQGWREFCGQIPAQPGESTGYLGSNYLGICERVFGPGAVDTMAMATGIRQVMDGAVTEFTLEYPCQSDTEHRWFLARITRFQDPSRNVVIAHENMTERKQALDKLVTSEPG